MSTVEDVQYRGGTQITKDDIPLCIEHPRSAQRSPHIYHNIPHSTPPHGTDHALYAVRMISSKRRHPFFLCVLFCSPPSKSKVSRESIFVSVSSKGYHLPEQPGKIDQNLCPGGQGFESDSAFDLKSTNTGCPKNALRLSTIEQNCLISEMSFVLGNGDANLDFYILCFSFG